MEEHVTLIRTIGEQTDKALKHLCDNCTHVGADNWLFIGSDTTSLIDAGIKFRVEKTGVVPIPPQHTKAELKRLLDKLTSVPGV